MMTTTGDGPTPPSGARIILSDGTAIPCDLTYNGQTDGIHQWTAVPRTHIPNGQAAAQLSCDMWPGRTSIAITLGAINLGRDPW